MNYLFLGDVIVPLGFFGAIVIIVGLIGYFGMRKRQIWHETVRVALEKGQPLPPALANASSRVARYTGRWALYRGIIWIAFGIGLSLLDRRHDALYAGDFMSGIGVARLWAPLPICVGIAFLIVALISSFQSKKASDPQDPANRQ